VELADLIVWKHILVLFRSTSMLSSGADAMGWEGGIR